MSRSMAAGGSSIIMTGLNAGLEILPEKAKDHSQRYRGPEGLAGVLTFVHCVACFVDNTTANAMQSACANSADDTGCATIVRLPQRHGLSGFIPKAVTSNELQQHSNCCFQRARTSGVRFGNLLTANAPTAAWEHDFLSTCFFFSRRCRTSHKVATSARAKPLAGSHKQGNTHPQLLNTSLRHANPGAE